MANPPAVAATAACFVLSSGVHGSVDSAMFRLHAENGRVKRVADG
jgi:hypothetical protein